MLRIGLTGGIASGKTLIAHEFVALGAIVIDTDTIAREVVVPGSAGASRLRKVFGDHVFATDGTLARKRLRQLVFGDPALRLELETLLHPLIRARTLAALATTLAPYAIVAVPLLVETGFAAHVDRVLVVTCPREKQIERLIARDAITRSEAVAMIEAQVTDQARQAAADDVIDNGGPIGATLARVAELHRRYLQIGDNCRTGPAPSE